MRAPGRPSTCTRSSHDVPARPILRPDLPAARCLRGGRGAGTARRGARGESEVRRRRARRGRGDLQRLRRCRRSGDRGARCHALELREHARRSERRGIRGRIQPRRTEALAAARPRDRKPLMARIEDYALIGDLQAAALVERGGSIDWLCFPRFDSGACFAALLGTPDHGRWLLAPEGEGKATRRYLHDTMVLETTWETKDGIVRVFDFMPPRGRAPDVVRIVEGVRGSVQMRSELVIRFDYGHVVPWVRRVEDSRLAVAGPDALCFRTPAHTRGENMRTISEFTIEEGERVPFVLTWYPSHEDPPERIDPDVALADTESFWRDWNAKCTIELPTEWRDLLHRSLMVLKTLTYAPTGGIIAAPTTSLPEWIGSVRNWDYRYCWLRDATLTLLALLQADHVDEALDWRKWLLRAVAGDPSDIQIMYGVAG